MAEALLFFLHLSVYVLKHLLIYLFDRCFKPYPRIIHLHDDGQKLGGSQAPIGGNQLPDAISGLGFQSTAGEEFLVYTLDHAWTPTADRLGQIRSTVIEMLSLRCIDIYHHDKD